MRFGVICQLRPPRCIFELRQKRNTPLSPAAPTGKLSRTTATSSRWPTRSSVRRASLTSARPCCVSMGYRNGQDATTLLSTLVDARRDRLLTPFARFFTARWTSCLPSCVRATHVHVCACVGRRRWTRRDRLGRAHDRAASTRYASSFSSSMTGADCSAVTPSRVIAVQRRDQASCSSNSRTARRPKCVVVASTVAHIHMTCICMAQSLPERLSAAQRATRNHQDSTQPIDDAVWH